MNFRLDKLSSALSWSREFFRLHCIWYINSHIIDRIRRLVYTSKEEEWYLNSAAVIRYYDKILKKTEVTGCVLGNILCTSLSRETHHRIHPSWFRSSIHPSLYDYMTYIYIYISSSAGAYKYTSFKIYILSFRRVLLLFCFFSQLLVFGGGLLLLRGHPKERSGSFQSSLER